MGKAAARPRPDEGGAQDGVIADARRFLQKAVLQREIAVVGAVDDDGVIRQPLRAQRFPQLPHHVVHLRDAPVIALQLAPAHVVIPRIAEVRLVAAHPLDHPLLGQRLARQVFVGAGRQFQLHPVIQLPEFRRRDVILVRVQAVNLVEEGLAGGLVRQEFAEAMQAIALVAILEAEARRAAVQRLHPAIPCLIIAQVRQPFSGQIARVGITPPQAFVEDRCLMQVAVMVAMWRQP
ncbi:MAG: hypothetical protein BWY76_00217 [bacterium ADurb.Bin429]|nr:MAG: hypothetical protein BWY76_00217 [bacterium ADurb.Bin429]